MRELKVHPRGLPKAGVELGTRPRKAEERVGVRNARGDDTAHPSDRTFT
jgi:hypothetical protein